MDGGGAFSGRLAGAMRSFYWYCVSLLFGGGDGGVGGGGRGSAAARRHLPDVTIRSIGGYEVVSFKDEAPVPLSGANRQRRRRRDEEAETQRQPTTNFRLVNRLSQEFVECAGGRLRRGSFGSVNKDCRFVDKRRENPIRVAFNNKDNGNEKKFDSRAKSDDKDLQRQRVRNQRSKAGVSDGKIKNKDQAHYRGSRETPKINTNATDKERKLIPMPRNFDKDLQRFIQGDEAGSANAKRSRSEKPGRCVESRSVDKDPAGEVEPGIAKSRQLRLVRQEEWMLQMSAKSASKVSKAQSARN